MSREIAREELLKHTTKDSVWIQIHGQVYDVTPWLRDHPGGSEVLMDGAQNGKDLSLTFEEIKHSQDARNLASRYLIGKMQGSAASGMPKEGQYELSEKAPGKRSSGEDDGGMMMMAAGVAALGAIGAAVWYVAQGQKKR